MGWTTPKTWTTEPLTSLDMNTQIRDNLNALKEPPTAQATTTSNQTISTTSYQDVSGTTLTLTTTGGDVMVGVAGRVRAVTSDNITVGVQLDSSDYTLTLSEAPTFVPMGGVYLITGVSAGTHTIRLRARVNTGNGQINVTQIWAREVS